MRKLLVFLAAFFAAFGIVFTILPLGTLALLPVGLALVLTLIAFKKSDDNQKKFLKLILIIVAVTMLAIAGKEMFLKDEVITDKQFDEKKIESKKEAQKDLQELEEME